MKILERDIKDKFFEYNKMFKTILITGSRQIGKTTFLKSIKEENRKYVTLDDWELRELARNNPKEFIEKYSPPVIIDEIQYAPKLMSYIKIKCDESEKTGLYWLTGSQKIELMKNVTESLVGRMGILEMDSFSYREINRSKYLPLDLSYLTKKENINKDTIYKKMLDGGMPAYILNKEVKKEYFFTSYINLYLERDIREIKQIEDLTAFKIFLISIASRAGQILNYASISKDTKKDEKTIKSWISVLEATGIIRLIYPIRKEELKRVISNPKIIFMDSGLCTYLIKKNTIESLKKYTNLGFLFENYIISELIRMNNNFSLNFSFSFYRDRDNKEIDLILEDYDGIVHPFEIKMSNNADISMISNFKVLDGLYEIGMGGVICNSDKLEELTIKNQIIPISSIIS